MRNLLSSLFFILIFVGLGAMAFAAAPRGEEAAQPAAAQPVTEVEVQDVAAPEAPAASQVWNTIGIPLDNDTINTASDLAAELPDVKILQKFVAGSGWSTYDLTNPFDPGTDFQVDVGDAIMVLIGNQAGTSPAFTLVGDVPPAGSVNWNIVGASPCSWYFITVPLEQDGIADASQLIDSFDPGTAKTAQSWDPTQGWLTYDATNPFDPGDNFNVRIGYPYFVCVSASQTWP